MGVYIREPINGLTHLFGAVLSFIGLLALIFKASETGGSPLVITAVVIFGLSMTLLYSASATYHMVIAKDRVIGFLRRIDHSMIYILIAGTYTPFCLISLKGTLGWTLFTIVTTLAVLGVVFKLVWFHCPRWLSTLLYIGMGWIVVFFSSALAPIITTGGMIFLVLGGIIYTIGGIIYALKPKALNFKHMGFHEIFHLFILAGSLCHFISVYAYVL
ncbi:MULTISPECIES: hemolysin III family protein [Clostridia]|uniref:PAQR family membrane homeostasis protein TrhA n=1 Tax=Clostridia TaxID=186801 RepID=UPI000EA37094|nr:MULTISPECIES: hemolysin III family protein [Clostridia]NBJ71499.1 hemolysin III family protein [Roseburia sp. 1XD42-34]RKI74323.1 hemolysin III family protein [Clostridium sp. 1xD42-85]